MLDRAEKPTMTGPAPFVNLNLDLALLWLVYNKRVSAATHAVCCFLSVV